MRKEAIREQVFTQAAPKTKEVEAFGAKFVLHQLSWAETDDARAAAVVDGGSFNAKLYNVALLILAARDEAGERVFEPTDRDELLAAPAAELDRLVLANLELQGLTRAQAEAGKAA